MHYLKPVLPFLLGWLLLLVTPGFAGPGLLNGVAQLLLFIPVVCIPVWMTGRISYVDIGWPLGLVLIGLGLLYASRCMYVTLVHYTGATPAEYYSVKKRPDYIRYQQCTNMFFPGPPRG